MHHSKSGICCSFWFVKYPRLHSFSLKCDKCCLCYSMCSCDFNICMCANQTWFM